MFGEEVVNRFGKCKIDIEDNNSGMFFFTLPPLTRRYRTYLLSQCVRRISCTFYTDTLFAKQESIIGKKCDKIFIDGEGFIHVNPMQSKSQSG